jgi:uncharacterized lipoprotein YddW (UPF0748 family)
MLRAICSHQFEAILLGDFKPENIDIMVEEVASANLNAIQLCVKAPGILYYPSKIGPVHDYCKDYDLLAETLQKCHAAGLEFHSYFPVAMDGGWVGKQYEFDNNGGMLAAHPDWRTINYADGKLEPSHFGCLSNPEYLDYVDQLIEEQCQNYAIDVLTLDFIRFNGRCFCTSCKNNYREMFGEKLQYENVQYCDTYTPKDVPGELEIEYRCQTVEKAVKRLSQTIRRTAPGVKVGAYVFTIPRTGMLRVFQDWFRLSKYLDAVFPMYYDTYSIDNLKAIFPLHRDSINRPLFPGMITMKAPAVHAERDSPEYNCSFLSEARRAGLQGFFLFNYEVLFGRPPGESLGKIIRPPQTPETLAALKDQILNEPAAPYFGINSEKSVKKKQ